MKLTTPHAYLAGVGIEDATPGIPLARQDAPSDVLGRTRLCCGNAPVANRRLVCLCLVSVGQRERSMGHCNYGYSKQA